MPSSPPPGDPMPVTGELPAGALAGFGSRPFGFYVHIPFCVTRCGYCDFNTYTDLGGLQASYADAVIAEIQLARRVVGHRDVPLSTVFFGGGTPTMLPAGDLGRILASLRSAFGTMPSTEVTTEANPETVDDRYLAELRSLGFTRVSFGMQSVVPHVLATLERVHEPGRPQQCVQWARAAGFEHVSLDLIYGTPGESRGDWQRSIDAALAASPDHISAYALIVEEGTRLAAQVGRGELANPDDDDLADKYLQADEAFSSAGLDWYEVSNWSRPGAQCRHNLGYWRGGDWWGAGPGAHSHIGGVRWWNVRHPSAYAASLAAGRSPGQARELLTEDERRTERIMLETRLSTGLDPSVLAPAALRVVPLLVDDGLLADSRGAYVLTTRGRLLADLVIRELVVTSDHSRALSH
jgi:putative oxygen-independent coproporphyrinogen III oxidase